jgi:predicted nucleic acid-binding protein
MILPDVNVLIYAYRRDSVDHPRYKRWLEDIVNGPSAYGISPQVIGSVVRVCAHPQIFAVPDRCEDVLRFGRTLLEQPNATLIAPGARHWSIFESLRSRPRPPAISCRMRGSRRSPSRRGVHGSPPTAITRGSLDSPGGRRSEAAFLVQEAGRGARRGYNFTDFSDDLTDRSYRHQGAFVNLIGTM